MPDSDPIERMAAAYWNRRNAGQPRWEEIDEAARVEQCKDMSAAVKELRSIAVDDPSIRTRKVAWLDAIITDHELAHSKPDPG